MSLTLLCVEIACLRSGWFPGRFNCFDGLGFVNSVVAVRFVFIMCFCSFVVVVVYFVLAWCVVLVLLVVLWIWLICCCDLDCIGLVSDFVACRPGGLLTLRVVINSVGMILSE